VLSPLATKVMKPASLDPSCRVGFLTLFELGPGLGVGLSFVTHSSVLS
jgi:hypothetical protein